MIFESSRGSTCKLIIRLQGMAPRLYLFRPRCNLTRRLKHQERRGQFRCQRQTSNWPYEMKRIVVTPTRMIKLRASCPTKSRPRSVRTVRFALLVPLLCALGIGLAACGSGNTSGVASGALRHQTVAQEERVEVRTAPMMTGTTSTLTLMARPIAPATALGTPSNRRMTLTLPTWATPVPGCKELRPERSLLDLHRWSGPSHGGERNLPRPRARRRRNQRDGDHRDLQRDERSSRLEQH